ncbi:MAG TPA: MgtC/SapB family protein [Verrucomicrobiae bacterium]|nr:MgtC/SapB family protein [Verrucomicrobiae bacterium]
MRWLLQNWHNLLSEPAASILLALISVLCGALGGAEREKKEKPAGLRTMTLVCLGSAVFTLVSFAVAPGDTRIAAQIVTGIGFLGAGAILRGALGVTGLTTAATIWVMAAIGMVVGMGYAGAGVALSLLVLLVLTIIGTLEKRYIGRCEFNSVVMTFDTMGGKTIIKLEELFEEFHARYNPSEISSASDGLKQLRLSYCHSHVHHRELLVRLAEMPEVREMSKVPPPGS